MNDHNAVCVTRSELRNLVCSEALVDAAESVPKDDTSLVKTSCRPHIRDPNRHAVFFQTHLQAGVPAEVLVREEKNCTALSGPLKGPLQNATGV